MNNTAASPAASGKLFVVAPMMDGNDNPMKSICYKATCAQRVQQWSETARVWRDCHCYSCELDGLAIQQCLQHTAPDLILFDAFEEGAEIAFTETFIALPVDELEEDGSDYGFREPLQ